MRHKRLTLSAVLLLGLGLTGLQAQESINTTGSNISGSGGSASYSIGQVVYTTITGTNGSAAQGVQQVFEISEVTGLKGTEDLEKLEVIEKLEDIKKATAIILNCTAYPNPTANYLTLDMGSYDLSNLSFQLFDINGRLIESKEIEGNKTSIRMGNLVPATYFIRVIQDNKEVKTFKIIKR